MTIEKTQLDAFLIVQKDFQQKNKIKDNSSKNSFSYYALWGSSIGFEKLKFLLFGKKNIISFLVVYLKDVISLCFGRDYEFHNINNEKKRKIVIMTSATKSNFNVDGSYNDRYFQINSKNFKQVIFYLNYLDKELPNKIDDNLVLYNLKKTNFFIGIKFLIKHVLKNLKFIFSLSKFISNLSGQSIRAENLFKQFKIHEEITNLEKIILPYEGQPVQQHLISESKKINSNLLTIGYDHSAPHSLPFHFYYRDGSPDILFVNGQSQIDHLTQFQNWPKQKIKVIPTLRYQKTTQSEFSNKIFLPYQIFNSQIILDELESFLYKAKPNSLNNMEVKIHPVPVNLISQKKLKLEIERLCKKYVSKFDVNNECQKTSFFVGATTGVIVALEKDLKVVHICFDSVFDSYSSKMWPNLIAKQITNNSLEYSLKKKNSFILFKNDKDLFKTNFIDLK